ncbi:MAG: VanZ family protein [Deltaproteobacteria bacterium]|nr:VanZ family protein [Deltaproteobacteria bacterium]
MSPKKIIYNILPILLYCLLIFSLSAKPSLHVSHDKIAHILAFGGMGFLFFRCFRNYNFSFREAYAFAMLLTILYGIGDEVHQFYVPGRSCDVFDVLADSVGAFLGSPVYEFFYRFRFKKTSSSS